MLNLCDFEENVYFERGSEKWMGKSTSDEKANHFSFSSLKPIATLPNPYQIQPHPDIGEKKRKNQLTY